MRNMEKPKLTFFEMKIWEDLNGRGGELTIAEARRIFGVNYKIKKEEFPVLLKELKQTDIFEISKKKIKIKEFEMMQEAGTQTCGAKQLRI
jgi:hypothetical protein